MEKNHDEESRQARKTLLGFWVDEVLGNRLKDSAWIQRKTLSALLREYCAAGLRREQIKDHRRGRKENHESLDSYAKSNPYKGESNNGR